MCPPSKATQPKPQPSMSNIKPKTPPHDDALMANVSEARWKEISAKYPHFPTDLIDLSPNRRETFLRLPRSVEKVLSDYMMDDPRDVIMLSTILNICCTTVPLHVLNWYYPSHKLGAFTMALTYFMWAQRFFLVIHYSEHRNVFSHPGMRYFLSCVLCVPFGLPCGNYHLHHLVMHHVGNNVTDEDWSSTEPFQRDEFAQFLQYWAKQFALFLNLSYYAWKKERYTQFALAGFGTLTWTILGVIGLQKNPIFTLWVQIFPFFMSTFVLMFGNFSQHILVHPNVSTDTSNEVGRYRYSSAITFQCINAMDNLYSFNDGYHVTHHINSRIHWTQHVHHFLTNLEQYVDSGVIVFDGIGPFDVGILTFTGQLDKLADHMVHFTKDKKPKEELIQELKARLVPVVRKQEKAL